MGAPEAAVLSPFNDEEFLARSAHLWSQSEGTETCHLLRLAVLRDLHRALHAQKSRCLAKGRKGDAKLLGDWESRVDELRSAASFESDMFGLLRSREPVKKRTRLLPDGLYAAIPREKLDRYDRLWEQTLAAEGIAQGWRLWKLSTWIVVNQSESWNQMLTDHLWPIGIPLWVDSLGFAESRSGNKDDAIWHGEWVVLAHPRVENATEFSLDLTRWPGSTLEAPEAPRWRLAFSPKKR